jgi:hypothetical protein
MPGYIIQYWDDVAKVYKEVMTDQPLPVTTVGSGSGGAEKVQVTGDGGDTKTGAYGSEAITNVGLDTNARVMGQNGANAIPVTAANTSVDGVDPNAVGLAANARLLGFNGTGWDRLRVDGSKNLLVSTRSTYIPANTGAFGPDSSNALQAASLLFAYDTSQNQYVSLQAKNNALFVSTQSSSTLTANVLSVTTAGTRVQLPSIACNEVTIIAKRTNTGDIYVGGSTVSSTVYGADLQAKDSITIKVSNANLIYIDSSVNGEGISYVAV